jgi:hypothetical protein
LITTKCLASELLFMVGNTQKSHGARPELNSVIGLGKLDWWNPSRTSAIQSRSFPMWFLDFSNNEKGALRQETVKWLTVCSTFSRSGWNIVRSASLAKGGTSKVKSNKVSPWTLQMALIHISHLGSHKHKTKGLTNILWGSMKFKHKGLNICQNAQCTHHVLLDLLLQFLQAPTITNMEVQWLQTSLHLPYPLSQAPHFMFHICTDIFVL